MEYCFSDLVDLTKLRSLMEAFYRVTGISSAIVEPDGKVILSVAWREICVKFHREHPSTAALCRRSDQYIKEHLQGCNGYTWYECPNGMIDAAAPIVIDGKHLATFFHGQFFFAAPDVHRFTEQARRFGFDREEYLAALKLVPILSIERLNSIMDYFAQLANMLAEIGLARIKQLEQENEKLQASDLQLFRIFNSTPNVSIQGHDIQGNLTFWNAAAEKLYGFSKEEVLGRYIGHTVMDRGTAAKYTRIIEEIDKTDQVYGPAEWEVKDKQGRAKTVYSTLFPVKLQKGKEFICMDVDVTEQKALEREVARLDRLNLVGEMAASIGHEVRNPMTTVRGYLQILTNKPCFRGYTDQFNLMIEELDRTNKIITEFLSLARDKTIDKKLQSLNRIIEAMSPLIYADAVKRNSIVKIYLEDIPDLHLDEKEIRQLLLNLVRNALEATESGGIIVIKTFCEKNEVVLAVQDNGSGIPKAIQEKVGTPFFSTKAQGTGLGLAICFSIATRHNAKILLESDATGTTFRVRFGVTAVSA